MPNMWEILLYPDLAHIHRTHTFCEIFPDENTWNTEYAASALVMNLTNTNKKALYYLLYARYGNSHIASDDEEQFKYKVWTLIWMYGPNWEKELALQAAFRSISDADMISGAKMIYNHAHNPGTAPTTSTLTELTYIDDQNTQTQQKGKLDAYYLLQGLLKADVTEAFLRKFEKLFIQFVSPEPLLLFEGEDEEP